MMITENVFILILIMAYGSFFYNYLKGMSGMKSAGLYMFSTFWFIIAMLTSVPADNQVMGLVSFPFAFIAGGLAIKESSEEMTM